MPVNFVVAGNLPDFEGFEDLILTSKRHPSVMAWTAAKGLDPVPESEIYLQNVRERIQNLPVYHLGYLNQVISGDAEKVLVALSGLPGDWGHAEYSELATNDEGLPHSGWPNERYIAIAWMVWLIMITFQHFRS
jgi:hypothetical protein